ncbi:MAG: DUF2202 domain-containing protein [Methanoregula sp.]|jgi:hypothetical protein|uniref:DUF2202 domain-containing protein n=1 Tax=Methanoregula sp. TaxID=2052170 RepID=UPI0025D967D4|nr:DUF2202 domain-containing protein [Methanoregula sp.]MCK9630945.1 DUF2202 domain-containing protein [Methanoregula sp.]
MRNTPFIALLFVVCMLAVAAGCTSQQGSKTVVTPAVTIAVPDNDASQKAFLSMPQAPLNETETTDILYLQEAEKFDHDLNTALYGMHSDIPVFLHIANASGVYMAIDNVILQRYGIPSPENEAAGVFTNQKLQQMYTADINSGYASATTALTSSATFEDMHIADLQGAMGRTDNSDLQFIYRQQLASARNNLRLLNQWITAYGGTYTPTYITQASYNEIISTPMEQIPVQ